MSETAQPSVQAAASVPTGFAFCQVALPAAQHAIALSLHQQAYRQAVEAAQRRAFHDRIYRRMFSVWN